MSASASTQRRVVMEVWLEIDEVGDIDVTEVAVVTVGVEMDEAYVVKILQAGIEAHVQTTQALE